MNLWKSVLRSKNFRKLSIIIVTTLVAAGIFQNCSKGFVSSNEQSSLAVRPPNGSEMTLVDSVGIGNSVVRVQTASSIVRGETQVYIRHMGTEAEFMGNLITHLDKIPGISEAYQLTGSGSPVIGAAVVLNNESASFVQRGGSEFGIFFDTASLNHKGYFPLTDTSGGTGGPQLAIGHDYDTDIRPWQSESGSLNMEIEFQIPHISGSGGPVVQGSFMLYFSDRAFGHEGNTSVAMILNFYESRGAYEEGFDHDGLTPYFTSPLLPDKQAYFSLLPDSSYQTDKAFGGFRKYGLQISKEQFKNIMVKQNNSKYSLDPADYAVRTTGALFEVLQPGAYNDNNRLRAGMSLKNLKYTITEPSEGNPYNLVGSFDGVQDVAGKKVIMGWTCAKGVNQSLNADIFLGGMKSETGVFFKRVLTTVDTEKGIYDICGTSGVKHRFEYTLTDAELLAYAGKEIYVYGRSPEVAGVSSYFRLGSANPVPKIPAPAGPVTIELAGVLEGIFGDKLSGWACGKRVEDPINVEIYLGAPKAAGVVPFRTLSANLFAESGVGTACGTAGNYHRFSLLMDEDIKRDHGNKNIYAYAVSPSGYVASSLLLAQYGTTTTFVVPPLSVSVNPQTGCTLPAYLGSTALTSGQSVNLYTSATVVAPATCSPIATLCENRVFIPALNSAITYSTSCSQSPPVVPSITLKGTLEGVSSDKLNGWACGQAVEGAVSVDFYLDAPMGQAGAVLFRNLSANLFAEPGVAAACGTSGSLHRFSLDLTNEKTANGGRKIYAYAKSPSGYVSASYLLPQYGGPTPVFSVPVAGPTSYPPCSLPSGFGTLAAGSAETKILYSAASVVAPAACSSVQTTFSCSATGVLTPAASGGVYYSACTQTQPVLTPISFLGTFEGVGGTGSTLEGWACGQGVNASIDVHFLADGQFVGGVTANQTSEAVIQTMCGASGAHRFVYSVNSTVRSLHCGKTIEAFAINPPGYVTSSLKLTNFPFSPVGQHFIIPCL